MTILGIARAFAFAGLFACAAARAENDVDRLVAAMLGDTPIIDDLRELTDTIGGRPTGSAANEAAVEWAVKTLRGTGVPATAEPFQMPTQWQELGTRATVLGDVRFEPEVVAKPFSTGTPAGGLEAPLVDGGTGTEEDFARLGERAAGSWLVVETEVLDDEVEIGRAHV